jgi:hypothetical protein
MRVDETDEMKKELANKERHDIKILTRFVALYCRSHHEMRTPFEFKTPVFEDLFETPPELCPNCAKLLKYGLTMRLRCPHKPKPMCKKCPDPCYRLEYREKIREVMKFSGMYLLKRGRIDLMYHYFR